MLRKIDGSARRQVKLGRQLAKEKEFCKINGLIWEKYVVDNFPIKRRRADELIRIGKGLVTVEQVRERHRVSQEKSRVDKKVYEGIEINLIKRRSEVYRDKVLQLSRSGALPAGEADNIDKTIRTEILAWSKFLDKLQKGSSALIQNGVHHGNLAQAYRVGLSQEKIR